MNSALYAGMQRRRDDRVWDPDLPCVFDSGYSDWFDQGDALDERWTTINFSTAIVRHGADVGGFQLEGNVANHQGIVMPMPAGDFTCVAKMASPTMAIHGLIISTNNAAGAGTQDWVLKYNNTGSPRNGTYRYTNWSTFSANLIAEALAPYSVGYHRLRRVGATVWAGHSEDGMSWKENTFTPTTQNYIGFGVQSASVAMAMRCENFRFCDDSGEAVFGNFRHLQDAAA